MRRRRLMRSGRWWRPRTRVNCWRWTRPDLKGRGAPEEGRFNGLRAAWLTGLLVRSSPVDLSPVGFCTQRDEGYALGLGDTRHAIDPQPLIGTGRAKFAKARPSAHPKI